MKLLRTLMLSLLATVALLAPLASQPAVAQTLQHHHPHGHHRVYWVYYRSCANSPWVCHGGYYQANQAVQAVNWFRNNGYDAYYR